MDDKMPAEVKATVWMPKAYGTEKLDKVTGMQILREMFPEGKATDYQFVLFSTSGVHGSYLSIEQCAHYLGVDDGEGEDAYNLTVVIVHHRTCYLQYGSIRIAAEDVEFLKTLRASSIARVAEINAPYE